MHGRKETEVGTIPEDWDLRTLGSLFDITSSKRVFQSDWMSEGVPFYRARELAVLGESGVVDNELFITRAMYERFRRQFGVPQKGDMLVTGVGTLGKTYVVTDDREFYFKDGNIIWFKIGDSVLAEFLRQLYLTPVVIKQIGDGSAGTTVGTYTISGAKKTLIPFPSPPERRTIAEALGQMDGLLRAVDRLIVKKRSLKHAVMQQLLTGHARLPGFDGEWMEKRLSEVCTMKSGQSITSAGIDDFSEYPCYGGNGLRGRTSRFTHAGSYALIGRQGALCGNVFGVEGKFFASEHAIVVTAEQLVDIRWLTFVLRDMRLNQHSESSAQPGLSVSKLLKLELAVPPTKAEQAAIADCLAAFDFEVAALEARREKTQAIKQGMMQELLTGRTRLVVPEEKAQ